MNITEIPAVTDDLIAVLEDLYELCINDDESFYKIYKNIPFNFYYTIEQLSVSKSIVYKDLCVKAKLVTNTFHKSIK
ncbi:MAG: hypothetical protein KAH32_06805 [Chlamydiia bacterium]|nr:hypothetical protein [Chlamydiia bacterium]